MTDAMPPTAASTASPPGATAATPAAPAAMSPDGTHPGEAAVVDPDLPQRPGDLAAVPSLLAGLQRDAAAYLASASSSAPSSRRTGAGADEAARQALVRQARALQQALATPRETMLEHCWAQPGVAAAVAVGVDRGLWRRMAARGDRPQTVAELAADIEIDADLLGALSRFLFSSFPSIGRARGPGPRRKEGGGDDGCVCFSSVG